jgi:hypothetical protein
MGPACQLHCLPPSSSCWPCLAASMSYGAGRHLPASSECLSTSFSVIPSHVGAPGCCCWAHSHAWPPTLVRSPATLLLYRRAHRASRCTAAVASELTAGHPEATAHGAPPSQEWAADCASVASTCSNGWHIGAARSGHIEPCHSDSGRLSIELSTPSCSTLAAANPRSDGEAPHMK